MKVNGVTAMQHHLIHTGAVYPRYTEYTFLSVARNIMNKHKCNI